MYICASFFTMTLANKSNQFKGILWALIGAIAMSNVYIFSKAALTEIHLAQFGFYWFGFGLIWNFIYTVKTGNHKPIKGFSNKTVIIILAIGLMELLSTSLFFIAIKKVENPAVVSFLADVNPLFVALLGFLFLKERFRPKELIGMMLTLIGAIIISYKKDSTISSLFISGSEYIILSAFIYAIGTIIAKKNINKIPPIILSINRVLFLFVLSVILIISLGQSLIIPWHVLLNLFIGSLLGPFLTGLANYTSLQYIEASKSTIIRSSRSLFVLIGAYLYFNILPYNYQLIGGLFTIGGVILISISKKIPQKRKKPFRLSI